MSFLFHSSVVSSCSMNLATFALGIQLEAPGGTAWLSAAMNFPSVKSKNKTSLWWWKKKKNFCICKSDLLCQKRNTSAIWLAESRLLGQHFSWSLQLRNPRHNDGFSRATPSSWMMSDISPSSVAQFSFLSNIILFRLGHLPFRGPLVSPGGLTQVKSRSWHSATR